ncbi:MAG: hypothetical protein IKX23_11395 [Treponema sp.]|nr:hypothetical protein [Treponema sp.]
MTDIGKFLSDVEKIKKHERQNNSGKCDYNRIKNDLRSLFERSTSCPIGLPGSIFEYWETTYILTSPDISEEPTSDSIGKLGAMLAFLDNSDEDQELLTNDDWKEIGQLVNYEAEDLPVDILQDMMMILVSKGAY